MSVREVSKGEVYWASIPVLEGSHIQAGERPVIIWCNQKAGKYSPVVQYIPITSKTDKMRRKKLPVQVFLEEQCPYKDSVALVEQFGCIDKFRLKEKICTLTEQDMINIEEASMIQQEIDIYEILRTMIQQGSDINEILRTMIQQGSDINDAVKNIKNSMNIACA